MFEFEFIFDPLYGLAKRLNNEGMNAIGNMGEMRFPNIYILSNIIVIFFH